MFDCFYDSKVQTGLALIGFMWVVKYILSKTISLVNAVQIYILPRISNKQNWLEYGKWAVVTGSTDGIGKEFALQLASKGLNIILISRNPEKLKNVADEITLKYKVKTKTIPVNFSEATPPTYKKLEEELKGFEIGVLVNNVGVYVACPKQFTEMDESTLWDHVSVNCGAVTMITRIILPQMQQRKNGAIINVSSMAANYPMAFIGGYSPSKMYMDYLSEVLRRENKDFGITVLNLNPAGLATKMISFGKSETPSSWIVPTPKDYVKSALSTFGTVDKCAGYLPHALQAVVLNSMPRSVAISVIDGAHKKIQQETEQLQKKK